MPRPKLNRCVSGVPGATFFKPRGIQMTMLETVVLTLDEFEALRLADKEGRYHEQAAESMGVSRTTFGRVLASARSKVAEALVNGKALVVQHLPDEQSSPASGRQPGRGRAQEPAERRRRRPAVRSRSRERRPEVTIAVSSTGPAMDSPVDERFGRCSHFVLVEPDTSTYGAVENSARDADRGAGVQAAQLVIDNAVGAVVTGACGPKAFDTLTAAGIKVYAGASGTVKDAVDAFAAGRLELMDNATGIPHSGIGR